MTKGNRPSWPSYLWDEWWIDLITEHYLEHNTCSDCWGSYDKCPDFDLTGRCKDFDPMPDPWGDAYEKAEQEYRTGCWIPKNPKNIFSVLYRIDKTDPQQHHLEEISIESVHPGEEVDG